MTATMTRTPKRVVHEVSRENKSDESPSMREAYVNSLVQRLNHIIASEMPKGMGRSEACWRALATEDAQLMKTCDLYERGKEKRAMLEVVAIQYLHRWRELAAAYREGNHG